ncbi:MAG: hypothetical protein ABUT39_19835 [Acidobacteriota bacterium]
MPDSGFPSPTVALEDLLGGVVRGVVAAQRELDQAALSETESRVSLPEGELHLRPVWFVFERTTLDLELSTFASVSAGSASRFECRPLDPAAVALRGYAAAAGARLHVEIAPLGAGLLRREDMEPGP